MPEFHLDQMSAGFLAGWARGPGDTPLHLTLTLDGSPSCVGKAATGYRSDLHAAGIGSGHLGFSFILDDAMEDGTQVEISDAASGERLYAAAFVGAASPGLAFALDAARTLPRLTQPYWQSMLACQDQDVVLSGALCLPSGTDLGDVAAIDCDTGELFGLDIAPAHPGALDRLWFVPGDVYDAQLKLAIAARRRTLGVAIAGRTSADSNLNLAVIPSTSDLQGFRFAGAERARRVAGSADTLHLFATGGLTQATQILKISRSLPLPSAARVLDWGCGAGRVCQFVAADRPGWRLSGADIDEVNIGWCQAHLSDQADFALIGLMPPTRYEDGEFDFIYGLSVITHLEQGARNAWIAELGRILKPRGYLLLTYMGMWAALQCGRHDAAMEVYASLASRGISDDLRDHALGEALSAYYKATYNTRAELMAVLSPHFEVMAEYPRSLCYQDAILLRRR